MLDAVIVMCDSAGFAGFHVLLLSHRPGLQPGVAELDEARRLRAVVPINENAEDGYRRGHYRRRRLGGAEDEEVDCGSCGGIN